VTTTMRSSELRRHQVGALARSAPRVLSWQPQATTMVVGIAIIAIGTRAGVAQRLALAGAVVAAGSGFLLDDPAAVTLAASPTSFPVRRLLRVWVVAIGAILWWVAAATFCAQRVGGLPLHGLTLEFAMLVAAGLAASAVAVTLGDRTGGGIPGAVFVLVWFATTYLPPRSWLPFPTGPAFPGASTRLVVMLAVAVVVLVVASRDPTARRPRRRATVKPARLGPPPP
jgi:hypothetical protein